MMDGASDASVVVLGSKYMVKVDEISWEGGVGSGRVEIRFK